MSSDGVPKALKIPLEFRSAPLGGTKGTKGFQLDIRSGTYGTDWILFKYLSPDKYLGIIVVC